jgi:Xaa-Pro aminopeptidase
MPDPVIPHSEYAARRARLLRALKNAVAVIFAGEPAGELEDGWRPHPHFEYLTGVVDEPGALLVLDPGNPVEARRDMLFLKPIDPEMDKWDGYRLEISQPLRDATGMKSIFRSYHLGRFLLEAVRRSGALACVHPLAQHTQPVSPDLELFRKVVERVPGVSIVDCSEEVAKLRASKSAKEVAMIQRAIDITKHGFDAVVNALRPGMSEFALQEELEHGYRTNGSRGVSFPSIVGSGLNSTVLHYKTNDGMIEDGDLVLVDSGCRYGSYGSDITRTYPANGTFTARQKEIYNIVLRAEEAAIKATRPGVRLAEIDKVARTVITKAGYGDFFIHSIGHHLGIETHDVTPDAPLKAGAVVTIEPGIYLPDEKIGVRIEDDVVVTKDGCRNLSSRIPKTIAEIEKAMAAAKKTRT